LKKLPDSSLNKWLPATTDEMKALGWDQPDVVLITGDAYIDHPSFGIAVIARVLEAEGYKVAIIAQPNWRDDLRDFKKFGQPRLFFGISGGNMDSMVNHYTARKRLRSDDAYTPGDRSGFRPDYAATVYTKMVKQLYPETPVILGGIEASMRRLTHYDYWSDSLKPSVLADSGADILVYGMGEKAIIEVARQIQNKLDFKNSGISQTAVIADLKPGPEYIMLPSHEDCQRSKTQFGKHFVLIEENSNRLKAKGLIEPYKNTCIVVHPPFPPSSTEELDRIYALPFTRLPHPRYNKKPAIPAYEMIRHSVTIHRGCFGGCSFCTISMQQGRYIQSRSEKSILDEIDHIKLMPDFSGYISDIGGPSANMYCMAPLDTKRCEKCRRPSCIYPSLCDNVNASHKPLIGLYDKIEKSDGIKAAFVTSGIRYDLFLNEKGFLPSGREYFKKLVSKHISGRLKVAPEHSSPRVLAIMRKPAFSLFLKLKAEYDKINAESGKPRQIVPYLISSHPGSSMDDTFELAIELKKAGIRPEQMQDFTPTPMTLSSVMHYCGFNPVNGEKMNVTTSIEEKRLSNSVILYHRKEAAADIAKAAQYLKNKMLAARLKGRL
jgi:uncharacterized radical SAM protein YgiQ